MSERTENAPEASVPAAAAHIVIRERAAFGRLTCSSRHRTSVAVGGDQGGSRTPAAWSGIVSHEPAHSPVPYTGVDGTVRDALDAFAAAGAGVTGVSVPMHLDGLPIRNAIGL